MATVKKSTAEKTPKVVKKVSTTPAKTKKSTDSTEIAASSNKKIITKKTNLTPVPKVDKNAIFARGARKTAKATALLWNSKDSGIYVNNKNYKDYFFNSLDFINKINTVFAAIGEDASKYCVVIKVHGSGMDSQNTAVSQAIAKCFALMSESNQKTLKELGFLTRDSRAVQSKNTGKPKARKKEQFSKR